jgi:hypothetical protein
MTKLPIINYKAEQGQIMYVNHFLLELLLR